MTGTGMWERICCLFLSCSKEAVEEVREKALGRMKAQWVKLQLATALLSLQKNTHLFILPGEAPGAGLALHIFHSCPGEETETPSTWRRAVGLSTVWALAPIKMLTWDLPWTTPSKSSGIFFFFLLSCNVESHLPISPVTQGGMWMQ